MLTGQIFTDILESGPLFFVHMGDLFYGDVVVNDENPFKYFHPQLSAVP